jgi:uncharacterized glyoxalase superfamily protein PhnB
MTDAPAPMPPMVGGVIPNLALENAAEAVAFYLKAFAAEEAFRVPHQDGVRLMHSHLRINGGSVIINSFFPEYGHAVKPVQAVVLHLQVTGVDTWWNRAVEAGCEVAMPLEKQFWGDRYGHLRDPFGVTWSMGASED